MMVRIAAWVGEAWSGFVRRPGLRLLTAVVAMNFALSLGVEFLVFQDFPNSADEYAYMVSAELFARGKLSVPSPPEREFFDVVHVVNDGHFYGKYPPGWPLLLGVGALLHVPWLVNPVLGALTLIAIYRLARAHLSTEVANASIAISFANPFFVFNSASYFSHTACLLFVTIAVHFALSCASLPRNWSSASGLGLSAGAAFLTRPFTTIVFLGPMLLALAIRRIRAGGTAGLLRQLGAATLPAAACLALFLIYNKAQTGNAFLQPFQKYDPSDAPSLPRGHGEWSARFETHVLWRLWQLNRWLPLSVPLLVLAAGMSKLRGDFPVRIFLVGTAVLFAAFFCYWGDGIVQYGPRYLYEGYSAMILVLGAVVVSFGKKGVLIALGMFTLSLSTFIAEAAIAADQITQNKTVLTEARKLGLSDAIVFIRSGWTTGPLWGPPGNVINFDASVLVVRNRGDENRRLLLHYPRRKAYYFDFDPALKTGRIVPVDGGGDGK